MPLIYFSSWPTSPALCIVCNIYLFFFCFAADFAGEAVAVAVAAVGVLTCVNYYTTLPLPLRSSSSSLCPLAHGIAGALLTGRLVALALPFRQPPLRIRRHVRIEVLGELCWCRQLCDGTTRSDYVHKRPDTSHRLTQWDGFCKKRKTKYII